MPSRSWVKRSYVTTSAPYSRVAASFSAGASDVAERYGELNGRFDSHPTLTFLCAHFSWVLTACRDTEVITAVWPHTQPDERHSSVSKPSASQLPTGSLPAALDLFAGARTATVGRLLREPGRSPSPTTAAAAS